MGVSGTTKRYTHSYKVAKIVLNTSVDSETKTAKCKTLWYYPKVDFIFQFITSNIFSAQTHIFVCGGQT